MSTFETAAADSAAPAMTAQDAAASELPAAAQRPAGPSEADAVRFAELLAGLQKSVSSVLMGKDEVVRLACVALVGQGHLLLEDTPGVGKTSLAKALAQSLGCEFTRVQCTPDMLPADIIGTSIYRQDEGRFEFRKGPVFTNVLLVDEVNRTTPRTQSALLEAMSERQVSADGTTYDLASPFFVLATQNPFEFEGTYPLPENQLDRFMLRLSIGYPNRDVERSVLASHQHQQPIDAVAAVLTQEQLIDLQRAAAGVLLEDSLADYLLEIVAGTREHPELSLGVSTRGALAYARAARGAALLEGRDYVVPDDIKRLAIPVLAHRVLVRGVMRESQREQAERAIHSIVEKTAVPG